MVNSFSLLDSRCKHGLFQILPWGVLDGTANVAHFRGA
jgi:hypothetical protein